MLANNLSAAFTTNDVEASKNFYVQYFDAKVTFDCGWYINLELGKSTSTLQFMSPQEEHHQLSNGAGLIYNIEVDDVDAEYQKLVDESDLTPVMPLDDHPWGDRGFAIMDPNGISLYIYSLREPSPEYKQYFIE